MSRLDCPSCSEYSGRSIAEFLRHIRLFHADSRPFSLRCNLGCGRERPFTNFLTFRDHVYCLHSGIKANTSVSEQELPPAQEHCDVPSDDNFDSSDDDQPTERCEPITVDYASQLQRCAATFILKVQEKHQIPQSTMESIIKEVNSLYQVLLVLLILAFGITLTLHTLGKQKKFSIAILYLTLPLL